MAEQAVAKLTDAFGKLVDRRRRHAGETLTDAADTAGEPVEDFFDRAVSDDRRHELLTRTLAIAQDTALREKRRALGRALAAGVAGEEVQIDEELMFIRAVADVDEMHIRLLARLAGKSAPNRSRWTYNDIADVDAGIYGYLPALLATLQLHDLVSEHQPGGVYRGPGAEQASYSATDSGRMLLDRLADPA